MSDTWRLRLKLDRLKSIKNGAIDKGDLMAALERNATLSGFVESATGPVGGGVPPVREAEGRG
jgi:hypothetical protein